MRRTRVLTLTLLAGAIAGCNRTRDAEVQRCIDDNGLMVPDDNCRQEDSHPHIPYRPVYRWVYGGNGGYIPGSRVTGYSEEPTPGMEHVTASSLAASGYSEGGARVGITESGHFTAPGARGGSGSTGEGHGGRGGGHGGGE